MAKELEQRAAAESAAAAVTRLVPLSKLSREARKALRHRQSSKPAEASTASDGAATVAPRVDEPALPTHDLRAPELYLNRELSWLQFNRRVLNAAQEPRTPLLERVKFLAIVSSNLDEFFMKRIGGLKQQAAAGVSEVTVDGRTPTQQIADCLAFIRDLDPDIGSTYQELLEELARHQIVVCSWQELPPDDQAWLRQYYITNIFPLVTPLAMDPAHPFPFISNLSLNLLVSLQHPADHHLVLARVKVPVGSGVPRFLKVGESRRFVPLEDVMARNLDVLFPDMMVESCDIFRVTRNASTERDEERAEDLLAMIESELRDRKFAPIVRLEVEQAMTPVHRGMLAAELELSHADDVFEATRLLGLRDLMEIASLDVPALRDPAHHPIVAPSLEERRSIFHIIRETGSILLHHPYESFATSVERFVMEASRDPKVLAIKMTLYRTSAGTRIIEHLVDAALNGKQVAVVVEIKARFDEAANIQWASRLEEVGIHVTYGVVGLKTHSKVVLVVRRDYTGLRRYAHIGTGNYHAGTARLYSDLGLLTCDDDIGADLTELFNYLTTGYKPSRRYRKILAAPRSLKAPLLDKIDREIKKHSKSSRGLIRLKANALEDPDMVAALYRAAQAGVRVELIIRDTCRLRPGIPGLSANVTVVSIIGRFLEHARIYYFRNGGDEEYFIGSADPMSRNLDSRVEVVTPVEAPALQARLKFVLDTQLHDRRSAWEMQADGTYVQRRPGPDEKVVSSQEVLIADAERRSFEANRLRKRRPRIIPRRPYG